MSRISIIAGNPSFQRGSTTGNVCFKPDYKGVEAGLQIAAKAEQSKKDIIVSIIIPINRGARVTFSEAPTNIVVIPDLPNTSLFNVQEEYRARYLELCKQYNINPRTIRVITEQEADQQLRTMINPDNGAFQECFSGPGSKPTLGPAVMEAYLLKEAESTNNKVANLIINTLSYDKRQYACLDHLMEGRTLAKRNFGFRTHVKQITINNAKQQVTEHWYPFKK